MTDIIRMTPEQKRVAIKTLEEHGTDVAAAKAAGVTMWTFRHEKKRSAIFRKRANEARDTGKTHVGDSALAMLEHIAFSKEYADPRYSKARLTANIALANAFIPGFKGTTTIQGHVDHDVRVITAIPRPRYIDGDTPKQLTTPKHTLIVPVTPTTITIEQPVTTPTAPIDAELANSARAAIADTLG
jgi:hypothetical protein